MHRFSPGAVEAGSPRRRILFAWIVLATIVLLAPLPESWQSLERNAPLPLDKLVHLLGTAFSFVLAQWCGWRAGKNALFWIAYSGLIELLQGATGFRAADLLDFLAACAGIALALVGMLLAGKLAGRPV